MPTLALPLNGFDRALLAQTYSGRPMTTHHVLETERPFARAALEETTRWLTAEFPTLCSVIHETTLGFRRSVVASSELPTRALSCGDTPTDFDDLGCLDRPFDLAHEAPFRLHFGSCTEGGYRLVFTLHHSVTDGAGALMLFDALLRRLAALEGAPAEPAAPISAVGGRLRSLLRRCGFRAQLSLLWNNLTGLRRFSFRRASLLEDRFAPVTRSRCLVLDVPHSDWHALGVRARETGCSRSELVLASLLRASQALRRRRDAPDEPFRVIVPSDLRPEFGLGRPLQNPLGVLEVDVSP